MNLPAKQLCGPLTMDWPNKMQLVLMPGFDGTGRLFEPFTSLLPQCANFKVISYPPDVPLSYAQLTEFVSQQIGSSGPFALVAESFSGPIAAMLASRNPDNLAAVVFCAAFASAPHHSLLAMARSLPLARLFAMCVPDTLIRRFLLPPDAAAPTVHLLKSALAAVRPEVLAHRFRCIAQVDVTALLNLITVPCCYIRARADRLIPQESTNPFVERIRGLVLREIEGPHLIMQANPEACLEAISQFLDEPIRKAR